LSGPAKILLYAALVPWLVALYSLLAAIPPGLRYWRMSIRSGEATSSLHLWRRAFSRQPDARPEGEANRQAFRKHITRFFLGGAFFVLVLLVAALIDAV
jgi:hypothetical protein